MHSSGGSSGWICFIKCMCMCVCLQNFISAQYFWAQAFGGLKWLPVSHQLSFRASGDFRTHWFSKDNHLQTLIGREWIMQSRNRKLCVILFVDFQQCSETWLRGSKNREVYELLPALVIYSVCKITVCWDLLFQMMNEVNMKSEPTPFASLMHIIVNDSLVHAIFKSLLSWFFIKI